MTRAAFTIPGKPFGKQRPRATRQGRVYTPAETVSFERQVGMIARPHFPAPISGPVRLTIHATFATPASWSQRKAAAHLHRMHVQRPDLDNIAKAIKDALNRIAWADDAQVAEMTVSKVWGLQDATSVIVEPCHAQL
jgi:Holliday junction resolvase RusA-like endonuclease